MFFKRKSPHLLTGERGERAARWYLLLRGYRILERNYLCPLGEIDIVALKKGVIVFVEVRTRQEGALVDPIASIDDMKLAHIMDATRYFLMVRKKGGALCRFDIISVRASGPFRGRIRHYIDAFRTTDERPTRGARLKAWIRRRPRP
jgi:putative endonuclease